MSQLAKLRQRINTIQTIQKIAQAMRLVSMSVHSQLNNQLGYLNAYQTKLDQLTSLVQATIPGQIVIPKQQRIMVLIGSQKGLCGSFNSDIIKALDQYQKTHPLPSEIVVIGKKLIDLVQRKHEIKLKITKFNHAALNETAQIIMNLVKQQPDTTEIICLSNQNRTFFTHTIQITTLNNQSCSQLNLNSDLLNEYTWIQSQADLAKLLLHKQLSLNLHSILLNSLIAEASSRFRSMDSATRNAETLLETSNRQYSKLRQAKITGELVELSAIFQIK